jgi:hypothetical protein
VTICNELRSILQYTRTNFPRRAPLKALVHLTDGPQS